MKLARALIVRKDSGYTAIDMLGHEQEGLDALIGLHCVFCRPACRRYVKLNSGAPPVLVAFGDYDAMRLRQFAAEHGGALVDGWKLFGAASLFSEAAE